MTPVPDYQLDLRPLSSAVPPHVRLRHVLKRLLRTYGFRCVACRELVRGNGQMAGSEVVASGRKV